MRLVRHCPKASAVLWKKSIFTIFTFYFLTKSLFSGGRAQGARSACPRRSEKQGDGKTGIRKKGFYQKGGPVVAVRKLGKGRYVSAAVEKDIRGGYMASIGAEKHVLIRKSIHIRCPGTPLHTSAAPAFLAGNANADKSAAGRGVFPGESFFHRDHDSAHDDVLAECENQKCRNCRNDE